MVYLVLLVANALEVRGTSLWKATDRFARLWPTVACLGSSAVAFGLLAWAIKQQLPVGGAYAMWSGLGTVAVVAVGVVVLNAGGAH